MESAYIIVISSFDNIISCIRDFTELEIGIFPHISIFISYTYEVLDIDTI